LLSASELQARGHFVYSPSDTLPERAKDSEDDNPKDKSYQLPKRSRGNVLDDDMPEYIFTSDGEEVVSETDLGRELVSGYKDRIFYSNCD
jgi:hypothetical protein